MKNVIEAQDAFGWGADCKYSTIILPYPPSINHYWTLVPMGKRARMILGKSGKTFRQQVKQIIGEVKTIINKIAVKILVYTPDRRKRDLDNLLKATLDSLQHAGVYEDDFQIDDLHIRRADEIIKEGKLFVYIREL